MVKITETLMFISNECFMYGQGDSRETCFADALDNVSNWAEIAKEYPLCFDMMDCIEVEEVKEEEEYVVCYDSSENYQLSFKGKGLDIKEKLLGLYFRKEIEAAWIFPMSCVIKTTDLECTIRENPASYNTIKEWLGEEW